MNNNIETYANITGFPNYQISNFGNVKIIKTGKIMKPQTGNHGYLFVGLRDDGETSMKKIHRLVASAFLENPDNKKCVDHKDRDKLNNHISNLRWATNIENSQNASIRSDNTSGVKGVWVKRDSKWIAEIYINGVKKHLGSFTNKEDAITARSNAEIQYFGAFRAIIA